MSQHSSVSREVESILESLCDLPGRKRILVRTKRYPRLLPAEAGDGFEQRDWMFEETQRPTSPPIPADVEDVTITWMGVVQAEMELRSVVDSAVAKISCLGISWDCRYRTRANGTEMPDLVVEITRSFE